MTTTDNTDLIIAEHVIDELAAELATTSQQTLNERINNNTVDLCNYLKYDGGKGRKTGKALLLNKIKNLSVIDIDINKEYDDEMKQNVRDHVISLLSIDDVIVLTGSGGLHIYCNSDLFPFTSNRMIKCYTSSDFDVDLMASIEENKRSLVVLPESRTRQNATMPIKTYSFVRGSYDSIIKRSVNDVLTDLNVKIKTIKENSNGNGNETLKAYENETVIDDNLAIALIDGLFDLEIHNDGGNRKIDDEITLFVLFQAINSLPKQFIETAYINVYECCKLTDNAKNNFENAKARYINLYSSPYVLAKILKLYNKDYYDEFVKPLLRPPTKTFDIDLNDSFCMTDLRKKAENKVYKNNNEVIEDLSKVIRFIDSASKMFVQKEWRDKAWTITFLTDKSMKDSLKMIQLWKEDRRTITAYDVLLTQLTKLTVRGVDFYSKDPNVLSVFQGYNHQILDEVNDDSKSLRGSKGSEDIISPFLDFVSEVVCDNNEVVYKYVIGWIASMIQNPGVKNETALILKGLQGIGKNRFTDVLCELMRGYSEKNVTDIAELTGNFNSIVENKMLIVLNELKNFGDDRMVNFNSLKSIITDDTIVVYMGVIAPIFVLIDFTRKSCSRCL